MRWHGAFTQNPYDSRFTLKFLADGQGVEVLGIDYTDNCIFPAPDLRPLNALISTLNEKLRR
jgi:hypothetical protein